MVRNFLDIPGFVVIDDQPEHWEQLIPPIYKELGHLELLDDVHQINARHRLDQRPIGRMGTIEEHLDRRWRKVLWKLDLEEK
jgi:hypothetical protein